MTGRTADLVVSEIFGPTWQGEGPSIGRRAGFVRLGRCNLDCSWCDTPYTWDWRTFDANEELRAMCVAEVVDRLDAMAVSLVVITGGEPLLQQARLVPLVAAITARGWQVEIETNGTIAPSTTLATSVSRWNVSPKLANSGITADRRIRVGALRALEATGRAAFKFVAVDPDDLAEAAAVVEAAGLSTVWVMPQGREAPEVVSALRRLAPEVLRRGWNLTPRLHTLIWDDRRGV